MNQFLKALVQSYQKQPPTEQETTLSATSGEVRGLCFPQPCHAGARVSQKAEAVAELCPVVGPAVGPAVGLGRAAQRTRPSGYLCPSHPPFFLSFPNTEESTPARSS